MVIKAAAVAAPVVSVWLGAAPALPPSTPALSQALSLAATLKPGLGVPAAPLVGRVVAARGTGAAEPARPSGPDYAAARELFEGARDAAPAPTEMLRWRAGRLFKPERPAEPLNSVLVGADVEGRGLRVFPIQTFRPVDEIAERPDLQQWIRDVVRNTPVEGPGPEFDEKAVRFGLCRGGVCHRYEVRRNGGLVVLRYRASEESTGRVLATWYGLYPKDVTPS
ncbi:MAG: hypothetical protein HY553_10925 [Elusimicrobia bacterium]|nr:hypothetical protein [Elusimicrobiota bacterium]